MRIAITGTKPSLAGRLASILESHGNHVTQAPAVHGANGYPLYRAIVGARVLVVLAEPPIGVGETPDDGFTAAAAATVVAAVRAGVRHLVLVSSVGADRIAGGWYFPAKSLQEQHVRAAPVGHTVLQTSPGFATVMDMLNETDPGVLRVPAVQVRPVGDDDVAEMLAEIVRRKPANATIQLAGTETITLSELLRQAAAAVQDVRDIVTDPEAPVCGARVGRDELLPGPAARLAQGTVRDWLTRFISAD